MKQLIKIFDLVIYFPMFKATQLISSLPARLRCNLVTRMFMRLSAKDVLLVKRGKQKGNAEEIGKEWQRMFPIKRMQRFILSDDDTVYY